MNANVIEVKPFNITKIELVALRGPKGETGYPTPEQVQTAVDAWLEDHPEATTTVQDGAITTAKLHDGAVTEDKLAESLQSLLITDTASGSIASFSDGSDGLNLRDLKVSIEPKQSGSGDPSPSNIRPITGWENVKVKRIWNQANFLKFSDATITANGITAVAKNGMISLSGTLTGQYTFEFPLSDSVNLGPGQNYIYFNNNVASTNINVFFFRDTTTVHYWSLYEKERVVTSWTDGGNEVVNKIGIKLATVGTNFDGVIISPVLIPKDDTTTIAEVTISLGSTVYGGTLDVTTGVLTVDRLYKLFNGTETWTKSTTTAVDRYLASYSASQIASYYAGTAMSNIYAQTSVGQAYLNTFYVDNNNNQNRIAINFATAGTTTASDIKQFFANNNLQIVLTLVNPTTVQLTPQQMTTLLGQNNVFSDAGNVDVTYVADTKLYIAKMIANALNA